VRGLSPGGPLVRRCEAIELVVWGAQCSGGVRTRGGGAERLGMDAVRGRLP